MIGAARPTEAELIELENWAIKIRKRFDKATKDEETLGAHEWAKKYYDMPWSVADRERLYELLKTVIAIARKDGG